MFSQPLRALVISPSASHPRDYGNRNRVWQTTSFLKRLGYDVTFILYPMERDWERAIPRAYADMKKEWAEVVVIPPSMPLHQRARGEHHDIDEWWDPQIGHYLSWLFQRQFFDVIFVNYSFFSRALEIAPKNTLKVLDTHDLFSGRKEMLAEHNIPPEFFYTTVEQERIAFDRADIILAIKDSEREAIRTMTRKSVLSLPYYPADLAPAASGDAGMPALQRPEDDNELVIGFIGADNSVNTANMSRFLNEMGRLIPVYAPYLRIVIAGNVCRGLWSDSPAIRLVGHVENIGDFYRAVDIVVAPLDFSTGIKIKVGEALSYGKPVVSTANGFDGYPAFDAFHSLPDIRSVCRALITIACDRPRRALLAERTAMAARMAALTTSGSLRGLEQALSNRIRRIIFVTDKPIWRRDTLWHERLYQWYELLSHLAPTTCVAVGNETGIPLPDPNTVPGSFVRAQTGPADGNSALPTLQDVILSVRGKVHYVISVRRPLADAVAAAGEDYSYTFGADGWGDADLAGEDTEQEMSLFVPSVPDVMMRGAEVDPLSLLTVPLRYTPERLAHWTQDGDETHMLVVLCSVDPRSHGDLDLIVSRLKAVGKVTVVGRRGDPLVDVADAEFLSWAATVGGVSSMILLGSDLRMRRLYRAAAGYLQIPCDEASLDRFPLLHSDAAGQVVLVHSVPQLLERILSQGSAKLPDDTQDGGWSTIWQTLEAA